MRSGGNKIGVACLSAPQAREMSGQTRNWAMKGWKWVDNNDEGQRQVSPGRTAGLPREATGNYVSDKSLWLTGP
jgi:hypothetical protein